MAPFIRITNAMLHTISLIVLLNALQTVFVAGISSDLVASSSDDSSTIRTVVVQPFPNGGHFRKARKNNISYLRLRVPSSSQALEAFRMSDANDAASNVDVKSFSNKSFGVSWPPSQRLESLVLPRFALALVKNQNPNERPDEASDSLLNTTLISLQLLESVPTNDPDAIRYKVELGGLALSADGDGNLNEVDFDEDKTFMDTVTLFIDLVEPDETRDGLSQWYTRKMRESSIAYQTKTGKIAKAYRRKVKSSRDGVVSAHGFLTGPLTFICCPAMVIEALIPLLWVFVPMKALCCFL